MTQEVSWLLSFSFDWMETYSPAPPLESGIPSSFWEGVYNILSTLFPSYNIFLEGILRKMGCPTKQGTREYFLQGWTMESIPWARDSLFQGKLPNMPLNISFASFFNPQSFFSAFPLF